MAAQRGTTAVIRARNVRTGEMKVFVSTEAETIPKGFTGRLQPGEEFVGGAGHAEEKILQHFGRDWRVVEGGTSRNICLHHCAWQLGEKGVALGGEIFKGAADKTNSRMFWRP